VADEEELGEALDVRFVQDLLGRVVAPVVVRVGRRLAALEVWIGKRYNDGGGNL
jgi:hypothetical protein